MKKTKLPVESTSPIKVEDINSLTIFLTERGAKGWSAVIFNEEFRSNYRFVVVGTPTDHEAIERIRSLIKQSITQPGTGKFTDCCCKFTHGCGFPIEPIDHPKRILAQNSTYQCGLNVLQCAGCGEMWTHAFAQSDGDSDDFSVWHHWGRDPEKIKISFDEETWRYNFKEEIIPFHMMKNRFPQK